MDIGKCQDKIGQFSWSKKDSNHLNVKLEIFQKDDNKDFQLVQSPTRGEIDFNQFMRLRNQLVNAAENFAREENLFTVLILKKSKNMDEQLKLSHKVVDVVDRANKRICVTLLRYNFEKPESFFAQILLFARKKENEKFQQKTFLRHKLQKFFYLLRVITSVYKKVFSITPLL